MEWMVVKTLLSLFAVLGLMVGVVFVLKKYMSKGQAAGASDVTINVLGHRMLAPKRTVHVLKVLNKVIIVGVTEHGMTALGEIEDENSLREIAEHMAERAKNQNSFSDYVEKYMRSFTGKGSKKTGRRAMVLNG